MFRSDILPGILSAIFNVEKIGLLTPELDGNVDRSTCWESRMCAKGDGVVDCCFD
jgi:hypothetical protein